MDIFFKYLNIFPMPLWLAMMFAPKHPLTNRMARSTSVFGITAIHYLLSLINAMRHGGEAMDLTTLDGVSKGLGTKEGALAGWAHFLALDFFTGAWIYRQCQRLNAPSWIRIPALLFTLMAGPFGLLIFLLWRGIGAQRGEALPTMKR